MHPDDEQTRVVLVTEEFERLKTARGVDVEWVDWVLLVKVDGMREFKCVLRVDVRSDSKAHKCSLTYQILHGDPDRFTRLFALDKDGRLCMLDQLRLSSIKDTL